MTNNEIIEAYFRARGWEQVMSIHEGDYLEENPYWKNPNGFERKDLPNILESYSAFKEHVLEVMEGEGYGFSIEYEWDDNNGSVRSWYWINHKYGDFAKEIEDNNILHAAVIAATRFWESKNGS